MTAEPSFAIPWGTRQLRRLGEAIRDSREPPAAGPTYGDVLLWNMDVAAQVGGRIRDIDWGDLIGSRDFEVASRAKTMDTLRQKLQRDRSTPLQSVQDVAGVRFEAEMSLTEQDAVVERICREFGADADEVVHDLRRNPHSGYRAVHIWLRIPARVEVQVRTHLQGCWANMYEAAADRLGRDIRYGAVPEDHQAAALVNVLQSLSLDNVVTIERNRDRVAQLQEENASLLRELRNYELGDTLPMRIVNALDIAATIDDRRDSTLRAEKALVSTLEELRRIFLEERGST